LGSEPEILKNNSEVESVDIIKLRSEIENPNYVEVYIFQMA
jgi:hypothetical protein